MRLALLAAPLLLLVAACGGGTAITPAPPGGDAVACSGSGGTQVAVADLAFNPRSASVAAGGTATWTNADSAAHTVTFTDGPDCGQIGSGDSVSATFSSAGEFAYRCTIHPSMRGTVVVQ